MKKVYTEADIGYIQLLAQDILSLNVSPVDNDDSEIQDFLIDTTTDLEKEVEKECTRKTLNTYLEKWLSPREMVVLRLRYGLEDGTSYTLNEIGERFGVTRERIRQIEAAALQKMRRKIKIKNIKKEDI